MIGNKNKKKSRCLRIFYLGSILVDKVKQRPTLISFPLITPKTRIVYSFRHQISHITCNCSARWWNRFKTKRTWFLRSNRSKVVMESSLETSSTAWTWSEHSSRVWNSSRVWAAMGWWPKTKTLKLSKS